MHLRLVRSRRTRGHRVRLELPDLPRLLCRRLLLRLHLPPHLVPYSLRRCEARAAQRRERVGGVGCASPRLCS
eukprot:4187521-Prymnesium_polylepis.1